MDTVKSLEGIYSEEPSVLTIGKFDGLHRGHMELVRRMDGSSLKKNSIFTVHIADDAAHSQRKGRGP